MNCFPGNFFEELRKITEPVRIDDVPDKLRTEHLKNTSTDGYHYTNLPAPRTDNVV
jgi:hypothetical protein